MNKEEQRREEKRIAKALKIKQDKDKYIDIKGYDIPLFAKEFNKFVPQPKDLVKETYEELTSKYGMLQLIGYCGYFIEHNIDKGRPKITKRLAVLGKCDCGRYTIGRMKDVKSGKKTSCGCQANNMLKSISQININETSSKIDNLIEEVKLKRQEALVCTKRVSGFKDSIIGEKYKRYQSDSLKRRKGNGILFDVSFDLFEKMVQDNCFYCNQEAVNSPSLNGLDRIDSDKDYTEDNIVACCPMCNKMKFTQTHFEFLDKIKQIAINQNLVQCSN